MLVDAKLLARLKQHNQDHLIAWWNDLDEPERERLSHELMSIDLDRLDGLIQTLVLKESVEALDFDPASARPPRVNRLARTDSERAARRLAAERGESALAAGQVAVVLVAGGQGTRLGFDGPKGCYPIAPVSKMSLFQIHAEKIAALEKRHGSTIPLYIMTSPDNHEATQVFWSKHQRFGLERVRFFVQGQMPAVDRTTGKILLAEKGRVALSPSGHGGTLSALAAPGEAGSPSCLDEMSASGIKTIFYFQVDNPMVRIADPSFLGLHAQARAEVSFKVIEKLQPEERLGVVVEVDDKPMVIEYSDLPLAMESEREPDGSLSHWAGSIAVHLFELRFLERLASGKIDLPFHRAIKKVPFVEKNGTIISPYDPNAVKFESFIFDTLPLAERYALVETDRQVEFEPLKNAMGSDSPESVRRRMSELFAEWLEAAGAEVARGPDGSVPFAIEISPLFALDSAELKAKIEPGMKVASPLWLREERA